MSLWDLANQFPVPTLHFHHQCMDKELKNFLDELNDLRQQGNRTQSHQRLYPNGFISSIGSIDRGIANFIFP
jgi:hypothetical protein